MRIYFIFLFILLNFSCSETKQLKDDTELQSSNTSINQNRNQINCLFQDTSGKENWTRIGQYPLDSISEQFACSLQYKKSDDILIAKYIGDNGAFSNETAFVLWIESEKEYLKEFYTNGSTDVLEKPKRELNWKSLRILANSLKIDTVKSKPKLHIEMSHNIGFAIQYKSKEMYFCDRLQNNEWVSAIDKTHPKVIFWKALNDLLKPTTDR